MNSSTLYLMHQVQNNLLTVLHLDWSRGHSLSGVGPSQESVIKRNGSSKMSILRPYKPHFEPKMDKLSGNDRIQAHGYHRKTA